MKPIRLLSLALFAALLAACSQAPLSDALPEPPAPADPHKIPVEKALGELEELLRVIDAPETRSGGARRVASVEALGASALARATRAGHDAAAAAEIGDLVYIANFQNGEGYAILGADDRIESVIAVTERGSLTPEQLAAAANGQYDGVEAPPVVPEIGDYLIERIGGIHKYDSLKGVTMPEHIKHTYGEWEVCEQKGPYCKMKWGQGAPYNSLTPIKDGKRCPVGCVAVALGQIVATNYYTLYYPHNINPQPQYLGNLFVAWNALFTMIHQYITVPNTPRTHYKENGESLVITYFLRGIGAEIGMDYGPNGSGADKKDAMRFLKAMGFKDVDNYYISEGRLKEMIVDRGLPVYACGKRTMTKGHAWVIDGMRKWQRLHTTYFPSTGRYDYDYTYKTMYHCNYGWSGGCDGYYYADAVYSPRVDAPVKDEIEGDITGSSNYDYTSGHKWMIYYNL